LFFLAEELALSKDGLSDAVRNADVVDEFSSVGLRFLSRDTLSPFFLVERDVDVWIMSKVKLTVSLY
jgi:hypothetical protein